MSSRENFAYLAGILDGEGTITVTRNRQYKRPTFQYRVRLAVYNTNKSLIDWLCQEFGGTVSCNKSRIVGSKDLYVWRLMSLKDIQKLLKECIEFLIVKKRQAELALEFISERKFKNSFGKLNRSYSEIEENIHLEIRKLNKRGC
jgi:hypothetical protein